MMILEAIIKSVSQTVLPSREVKPWLIKYLCNFTHRLPTSQKLMIIGLLTSANIAPLAYGFLPLPFLSESKKEKFIQKVKSSENYYMRMAILSIRTFVTIGLFSNKDFSKRCGV